MLKKSDPWEQIDPPSDADTMTARRISEVGSASWGLYWAVDVQHRCLLVLQYRSVRSESLPRLPTLRGLLMRYSKTEDGWGNRLIICLVENDQRDVFLRFCADIIEATKVAKTETQAIRRFLRRTWSWHRLLTTGSVGRLSVEEQKGLAGELRFLKTHVFQATSVADAVESWLGPYGAPNDFQLGLKCVEVKTYTKLKPYITISSIQQLDTSDSTRLFLYSSQLERALETSNNSFSITELVDRVKHVITERDPSVIVSFEERLSAVGFDQEEDYSDCIWLFGREMLFHVADGFPRISSKTVPNGIDHIQYRVEIAACEPFAEDLTRLPTLIFGDSSES